MDDRTSAHGAGQPGTRVTSGSTRVLDAPGNHAARHRAGIVVGVAACVALIGVPVGLLAASGPQPALQRSAQQNHVTVTGRVAKRSVLAALSATTDSGNFAFTYQLDESPDQNNADSSNGCLGGCPTTTVPQTTDVQGSGTINTSPMAMAASAAITTNGVSSLQVGVRVDPTTVWEVGYADNGLTSVWPYTGAVGSPLAGFAGLVEGTLGPREGPVAMMGMASPTGYLDLVQPAVTSATEVGTATVEGVAVTQYQLTIDPGSLATAPGTSSEEQSAINAAIQALTSQGYRTIHDTVSIDASGFIRESVSTVTFSDGGTVTLDAQFSNFGCAGTVVMPGQVGTRVRLRAVSQPTPAPRRRPRPRQLARACKPPRSSRRRRHLRRLRRLRRTTSTSSTTSSTSTTTSSTSTTTSSTSSTNLPTTTTG